MEPMESVAADLRVAVGEAREMYGGWGEAEWRRARGAGKWTRLEILGHLIDSAVNNHQRIVRALADGGVTWPGYDQVAMVRVQGYGRLEPALVTGLWEHLNLFLAEVVERIPAEREEAVCVIGGDAPVTLGYLVTDYVAHLRHHLRQMEE